MDPPGAESSLRDLEAPAPSEEDVAGRYADVVERHLGVAMRGVVVAKNVQQAINLNARQVERNQNHRLLFVLRGRGVGIADEDRNLATGIASAR